MLKFLIFIAIVAAGVQCERDLETVIAEYRAERKSDSNPCVERQNNIFLRNPRGCSWFYTCFNNEAIPNRCPAGYHFNEQEQNCDFPENVNCDIDDGRSVICPRNGLRLIPHPYSCSQYTVCFDGIQQDRDCPGGLHFSYFDRDCIDPFLADCDADRILCGNNEVAGQPTFIPNSRDCESYFLCVGSQSTVLHCRPGSHFDPENNWCAPPEEANCTSSLPSDQPEIPSKIFYDCPEDNDFLEFHPHPEDCKFYFACIRNESHLQVCGNDLLFDIVTRRCSLPNAARCIQDIVDE